MKRLWLTRNITDFMGWSASLLGKVFHVVPLYTTLIVTFSIASQLLLLLAFFLPLKVVILIGSEGVPWYFPSYLSVYGKEQLIFVLAAAAIVFYAFYMLSEKLVFFLSENGAQSLLSKSDKLVIFANQDEMARQFFQRYTGIISAFIFSFLAFLGIAFIDTLLALSLLVFSLAMFVSLVFLSERSEGLQSYIFQRRSNFFNSCASIAFLVSFGFIVISFLFVENKGVFVAIVSLLLSRQLFQRVSQGVVESISLSTQREQINSLFFYSHSYTGNHLSAHLPQFWEVVGERRRSELAEFVLTDFLSCKNAAFNFRWRETGTLGVVAYEVEVLPAGHEVLDIYLIKIFDSSRTAFALHEQKLMSSFPAGCLPAYEFAGGKIFEGYHCHLFIYKDSQAITLLEQNLCSCQLLIDLWSIVPPKFLVNMFYRSRPTLSDRLKPQVFERLLLAADSDFEKQMVLKVIEILPELKSIVGALPLSVYNSDLNVSSLLRSESRVYALHWGAWTLEPIGAGWLFKDSEHKFLRDGFDNAAARRRELHDVDFKHVSLASLMYALDFYCRRQSFRVALDLLPKIQECLR